MDKTLLIDADTFIYRAALKHQEVTPWDPEENLWTYHGNLKPAIAHLDNAVEELKEKLEAEHVVMALSDYTDPWRKKILPTYKENRKDTPKPILYKPLRDYVHEEYETVQRPGLEGDDILGILMTIEKHPLLQGERICCSIDKDLKTVPGKHFNADKDEECRVIPEDTANTSHLLQTLSGDTTDGYGGCPGIGPVKAERILEGLGPEERWPAVVAAYVKAGLSEEAALVQARVARILRASDYNFKTKEVILWQP